MWKDIQQVLRGARGAQRARCYQAGKLSVEIALILKEK